MSAERRPAVEPTGFVYFVQRGKRGPIKIGNARNPAARITSLQTACAEALILLGSVPGSIEKERGIHRDLAADRLGGEWFKPNRNVRSYIRRALREHEAAETRLTAARSTLSGIAAVERALATVHRLEQVARERRRQQRLDEAREAEAQWHAAMP